jgi:hypothetical protein
VLVMGELIAEPGGWDLGVGVGRGQPEAVGRHGPEVAQDHVDTAAAGQTDVAGLDGDDTGGVGSETVAPLPRDRRAPIGAGVEHDHGVTRQVAGAERLAGPVEGPECGWEKLGLVVHGQHDPDRERGHERGRADDASRQTSRTKSVSS